MRAVHAEEQKMTNRHLEGATALRGPVAEAELRRQLGEERRLAALIDAALHLPVLRRDKGEASAARCSDFQMRLQPIWRCKPAGRSMPCLARRFIDYNQVCQQVYWKKLTLPMPPVLLFCFA